MFSCKSDDIQISGEFPVEDAEVYINLERNGEKWRIRTLVKDGKFRIPIDSLEKGIYNVIIKWSRSFDTRHMTYRNKQGVVIRAYEPKVLKFRSMNKLFYVNPEQSRHYHISPEKKISQEFIDNLDSVSYLRTHLFRLKVTSDSEDAQLFEKLDSAEQYFRGYSRYLIFDSLYKASNRHDKIAHDFLTQAHRLNIKKNYPILLKTRREIITNHLDNPIAAWSLLDIGNDQLLAELDKYEALLKQMNGRAKKSPYYKQAMLKLDGLKRPLAEGQTLLLPTGRAPAGEDFNFSPTSYKYTLVEFWASWCAPCRVQNPDWNELLYQYKDEGFRILGVSLDVSKTNWIRAIEGDHLDDWLHVSDLGDGFSGSNALRYGIQAIPFNILIDQQGRIVTLNIGPQKLSEFLKEKFALNPTP